MAERERKWQVFIENRDAVIDALRQGRCDGILPAARGFLDGFAQFLLEAGILAAFEQFPDPRDRRSIPIMFFCHTLVYRPLFNLPRLAPIERTLFRSPYILRQLGFNALQIGHGFYESHAGTHPFCIEAIAECFAQASADDFLNNQQEVLKHLVRYCPGELRSQTWAMDSVTIRVPRGAHTVGFGFKACVLGVWQESTVWPLLWCFVPEEQAESVVGKKLIAAAEATLGPGGIRHLLIDRGYLDGAWLSELYRRGMQVTIGVKADMLVLQEMMGLSQLTDTVWTEVDPPKRHAGPLPQRTVTDFTDLEDNWVGCEAPLSGCLIRDRYPDRIEYQGVVTTVPAAKATQILNDHGKRWTIEEVFMTLTRYWRFDDLPPCRPGVAYALVHFALLAFTLLGFYLQETDAVAEMSTYNLTPPPLPLPERELAVYAGPYFTLFLPSELVAIILQHVDAWQANRAQLLMALRLCEGVT
jgi:hypothetical protein